MTCQNDPAIFTQKLKILTFYFSQTTDFYMNKALILAIILEQTLKKKITIDDILFKIQ